MLVYFNKSMQMILIHTLAENHIFKWARIGLRTLVSRNEVYHSKREPTKSVAITRLHNKNRSRLCTRLHNQN